MNTFYFYEDDALRELEVCFLGDDDDTTKKYLERNGKWICGIQWSVHSAGKPIAITPPHLIERRTGDMRCGPEDYEIRNDISRSLKKNGYKHDIHYVITQDDSKCKRAFDLLMDKLIKDRIEYLNNELSNFKERAEKMKKRYGVKNV